MRSKRTEPNTASLNENACRLSSEFLQVKLRRLHKGQTVWPFCLEQNVINKPNGSGLARIIKATECSRQGMVAAWRFEAAFRQEAILAMCMFPFSFVLASSLQHWALLVGSLLLVMIVELLNSAIEALTDRVSLERHELSGRAKDMGSAAVTFSLLIVGLIWGVALFEKLAG